MSLRVRQQTLIFMMQQEGMGAPKGLHPCSLTNRLKEPPVFLADVPRFLKGPRPLFVEALKVALDVTDVEIEIASDEVRVLSGRLRVIWHKGSLRRITGLRGGGSSKASDQKYSQRNASSAQPWRVKPPQNLIEAGTRR